MLTFRRERADRRHSGCGGRPGYVSGELAGELLRAAQPKPEESLDLAQSISPRQRRILRLLADGCSAKEIARQLEISACTVESHKYRMMESLGLHTSA